MWSVDPFTDFESFLVVNDFFYPQNYLLKLLLQNMIPKNWEDSFHNLVKNVDVFFYHFFFMLLKVAFNAKMIKKENASMF